MIIKSGKFIFFSFLVCLVSFGFGDSDTHSVIYWNNPKAIPLQKRLSETADFWRLIPHLTTQKTQTYCGIASAVTVLNTLGSSQQGDPIYYPYTYLTQDSFFTPSVLPYLSPKTVMSRGADMTELKKTLETHGVQVKAISGDSVRVHQLRSLLSRELVNGGNYILVNYQRARLRQKGEGHWSVLGAYDADSDRVLILDVARFRYLPGWVNVPDLLNAINTVDANGMTRGLLVISGESQSK